ncbi:MAG: hypothetical protein M3Y08_16455, partial [Fibrobacterota bacterium]|nr:hypothetical protein [Fibrobacterota bacterium]
MFNRAIIGRTAILSSALAGLLLAGCNNGDENTINPATTGTASGNESKTADHGFLAEPKIPTLEQIKAMESLFERQKPVLPLSERPDGHPLAKSAAADVNVGFNDYGSLAQIKDQAYATFADAYFQWVTPTAYAVVAPLEYGHFHLGYENPKHCYSGYNGFVPAGKYGIMSGNNCIVQGPAAGAPRNLGNHVPNQTIQFYVYDRTRIFTFDFKSFYLPPISDLNYGHVQIWINKVGVGWRYWADLPPATGGFTWYLPQTGTGGAQGITEVRITSPT